uniref:Uncharacterized protein n=1 Tax=Chrysemys picta bellii TaxID=8478 RepID=A0A8C3IXL8_CHRPI
MATPSPSSGSGSGSSSGSSTPGSQAHTTVSSMQGFQINFCEKAQNVHLDTFSAESSKRKALKLNFANPPFKSTARFTLNTSGVPFQNPHMFLYQISRVLPKASLRDCP